MGFDIRETEAVLRVMSNKNLSGYMGNVEGMYGGPEVQALEREWEKYFNVKHAIAVNSNTSGLWCALAALNLKAGDGVLVTPYSMTCSASLPLLFGAVPVFVDIEEDYFCMDAKKLEETILDNEDRNDAIKDGWLEGKQINLRAILIVDLFGQPYDVDAVNAVAKKYGLVVIEDAAQAPGATYKGQYAGTLGDIGVFSLNYHKHIHCGEGGIVVTDDDDYDLKIRLLMNHAEAVVNDFERKEGLAWSSGESDYTGLKLLVGMNLRMTELSACIARVQLTKLDSILKRHREDWHYFPVKVRPECQHSFYRYAWTSAQEFFLHEFDKFIMKQGYITPIYQMPLLRTLGYDQDLCPVCEEVNKNITLAWRKDIDG
jgi:dTDP-4-amino-4,6-dideoxygalactose transaminase